MMTHTLKVVPIKRMSRRVDDRLVKAFLAAALGANTDWRSLGRTTVPFWTNYQD